MQNKMSKIEKNAPLDLFNDDSEVVVLAVEKSTGTSNLYKPDVKLAQDSKFGYVSTIRFIPEITNGEAQYIISKEVIYVDLSSYPDLAGSYDSMKNFPNERCALNQLQWQLKKSTNVVDQEMAKNLKWYKSYVSLIQVVNDPNQPHLNGKIMVFKYGQKIKEKIDQELSGLITGEKCNVFNLVKGKNFRLVLKSVGGFNNYDQSTFLPSSVIDVWDSENNKFVKTPVVDGKVSEAAQKKILSSITNPDIKLSDFQPQRWDDETKEKVNQIVKLMTGGAVKVSTPPKKMDVVEATDTDLDNFFGEVED